jgi:hypothetical protein
VELGSDSAGHHRGLSVEADDSFSPWLAGTARLEAIDSGRRLVYPAAGVTYYPFHQYFVRVLAETVQAQGHRSLSLYLFGQL